MKVENTGNQPVNTAINAENKSSFVAKIDSKQNTKTELEAGTAEKFSDLFISSNRIKHNLFAKAPQPQTSGFGKEATVSKSGDKVTIETTAKDDKIGITQDTVTGDITVDVNGKTQTFSGKDKDNLIIKAGEGNDTVTVDKGVTVKLIIDGGGGDDILQGGSGDDTITGGKGNDKIEAGAGDDDVDGGDGRDYINGSQGKDKLAGGSGNDVIYGGDDADTIDGGDGDDYLEGSKGNDTINGGKGEDILSGGLGDDTLKGGDGDDVIYGGAGKDDFYGEKGKNKIYSQKEDTDDSKTKGVKNTIVTVDLTKAIGSSVTVTGSDEFEERVEADIEMLRSSTLGRKMLEGHDNSKHSVTINEASVGSGNGASTTGTGDPWYDTVNSKKGSGVDGIINYEPSSIMRNSAERPPVIGLFHEMAHTYDYTNGTLRRGVYDGTDKTDKKDSAKPDVNVRERVATGLTIDDDSDPKTKEKLDPQHPIDLTENGFREEMNLPKREHYRD